MAKNKETTIDELAIMVQNGFQSMDEKMNKGVESVSGEINGVKGEIKGMKEKMSTMTKQIDNLQRGQVHIEDRLDEIAPQIKEQKEIVKDHGKRLTILENKVALAR